MLGTSPVTGVRGVVGVVFGRASRRLIVAALVAATTLAAWASPTQAATTGGNASITMNKTVTGTSINPNLTLTLAVDKPSAIPGDKLTYTATVTNTGASLGLTGQFQAQNDGSILATISDYYDEVEYFTPSTKVWTPIAGVQVTAPGYTPLEQSPAKTGLNLTLVPMNASGVTYPSSGDPIIGTQIAITAVAGWNYSAMLPLSLSQIATLSDPNKVAGIRNVVHFEATPRNVAQGQPFKFRTTFTDPFLSQNGAVGNIVVAITLPDGSKANFDSTNTPAFVSLAAGLSASVTATFSVPVAPARASSPDDASYGAALTALEGALLKATATASGSATGGPVTAAAPPAVTTIEHLPIVSVLKSGPATTAAGTTEANPLTVHNTGGAAASALAVVDSVPAGGTGTVTGLAATLAPGGSTSATANFPVPAGQAAGALTDTASLTWQDANGNSYGPVSSSFTTSVSNTLTGATLGLSPAGPLVAVKGNSETFTATLLDGSSKPVANQTVLFAVTGANPTSQSGTTDANGTVQFSYGGTAGGVDQVQASVSSGPTTLQSNTVTVNWLVPIVAASTSPVNATFYPDQGCNCFTATPGLTPYFSTTLPTININPPTGSIPHMPPSIGTFNRPMISVATDVAGNFSGATVVQGTDANGVLHQAGVNEMASFQAVFTGNLTIAKGGNLLLSFFSDDGYIIGIPGATYVSGALVNPPASGLTAFKGYPVVGAFNVNTAPQERDVTVNFPAAGQYPYEVDYFECCGDGLAFTFGTGGNAGMAPTGNIAISPYTLPAVQVGQNVSVNVAAMDASGSPMPNLTIDLAVTGANAQHIHGVTDSTGFASFSYQSVNAGQDSLQASAPISGVLEISNVVTVQLNPAPPAPTITAPSPADGAVVTKPVNVSATFTPPAGQSIASWQVTYQGQDPGPVVPLASGTGTPPSVLAVFDPTILPNDAYAINISATASGGGVQTITATVIVLGYLKPGRYITTYQDLNVPVVGFQMQVRRQYDSFDKQVGDFGVGWRVSISNFRVSTNRELGAGGWTQYNTQCGLGLCLTAFRSTSPHFVTIVFPDQHTEVFDFTANGGSNIFVTPTPVYTARAGTGTTSTLAAMDGTSLSYRDDGNLYDQNGNIFDPQQFKLTLHDGTVLILDRRSGLVSMTNRSGEFVQVNSGGITARSGEGIAFTRDSSGRITQILGPAGQTLKYTYSSAGDLASSTDAVGNVTTYTYDSNHDLLSADGPGGLPLQTEQYDASGRLIAVTDANGNTTQVTNNVAGQQQTIVDPTGKLTTVLTMDDLGDVVRQDQVFDGKTLTTTATYDSVGRPLSKTDPLGHKWTATYNENGDPTSATDPLGGVVNVTYDAFGAPLTLTDQAGNATTYTYDSLGNLQTSTNALGQTDHYAFSGSFMGSHTDALGRTWTYNPDGAGNVDTIRNPLGDNWRSHYNTLGEMTQSIDPAGNTTNYTYDAVGNLLTVTDALGHVTTMTYNSLNELVTKTDALGKTTTYTYDGNRALTSVTDPLGHVTSYTYDGDGRQATMTDPNGGVTTYTYDGAGRMASDKDPLGRVTTYAYDDAGHLISKTMPNGGIYTYGYDAVGNQTSVTDPLGHTTTSGYDAVGRLVSVTDPLGNKTIYGLDALGRLVTKTDSLHGVTQNSYDAAGQLVSVTDALQKTTTYGYDANGNQTSVTDPLGHTTTYGYDQDNRVNSVTDPLGRFVIYNYDQLGRVISTRLFSGIFTHTTFDAVGHMSSTADGLGDTTSYTYDDAGRRVTMTDPNGHTTTYGYDATGRQTSITDALGGKVSIGFDLAGQQTSTVNPRGDTTSFTYDALGNVLTQTDPAGETTSHTYDLVGQLTSTTDPRGVVVTNTYDAAGQLTGVAFPGGSISQSYDALGRRTSMSDPTGTTTFAYDAASRLTSVAAPAGTVGYTYDAAGNRSSMAISGRGKIQYTYDAANELATLTDWTGGLFGFTYTADGFPAAITRPGAVNTTFGYDGADRLTSVHHDGPSGSIAHFDYTLDANGNRTSMSSAAGTESYSLDSLNRLTAVTYPNGDKAAYTYDAAGNRLSSTLNGTTTNYTYDAAGRLTMAGASPVTYDSAGNITSIGSDTYSWDWAGRLASSNVGGLSSSYTYDGDGVRVGQTIAGSTTNYVWDRAGSLPLLVDDGTQGYVQTAQGVLEQLGSTATYPLADGLGSVRTIETSTPSALATTSYDVFGAVRSQSGQQSIFGFTGQQTDPTGLSFLRSRYYDSSLGRFISPDILQPDAAGTQGYDPFAYAANNPTTATDPTGRGDEGYVLTLSTIAGRAPQYLPYVAIAVGAVFATIYLALFLHQVACSVGLPICATAAPAAQAGTSEGTGTGTDVGPTEDQKINWRDVAKNAVKACIAAGVFGKGLCQVPFNVYAPASDQGAVFSHDAKAILQDQPFGLVYTRKLNAQYRCDLPGRNFSCWYDWPQYNTPTPNACGGSSAGRGGLQCDEYPFLSTQQGGPPASADGSPPGTSLMPVSAKDNGVQGTSLSQFYGPPPLGCGLVQDNPVKGGFLVIPLPEASKTTWYCGPFNR